MNIKKTALSMLCAVLLFVSGIVPNAFANWYDDISGGRYVDIKGKNCAVDYFCGVPALYNEGIRSDDYESHAENERTGQEAQ